MPVVHIEVAGRVQGIGFRGFVQDRARALQLAGWVRNLSSGNVEIAASGSEEALRALLAEVREGPRGAEVKQVISLVPQPTLELPHPFTVLK
ncbi:MAG TPA: acylphosphatase [Gemmatimonadaceae bacterium]|nr:acylphosphatase [Gemmatimonadaceae bacterium]